ncbi:MAG: hypothetical protein ACKN9V_05595, partial [Pseudomonadota bacterium]
MRNIFLMFVVVINLIGCTKKEVPITPLSPEETVRNFVRLSGEAKEAMDKKKLTELRSGEMKRALQKINDEQFTLFYLSGN